MLCAQRDPEHRHAGVVAQHPDALAAEQEASAQRQDNAEQCQRAEQQDAWRAAVAIKLSACLQSDVPVSCICMQISAAVHTVRKLLASTDHHDTRLVVKTCRQR
jgi:hypothetical protein